MSNFLELCNARQSCRKFSDQPVEHEKLVSCVEAARLAPSACNSQPWHFFVAESPEVVAQIAKAGQQLGINAFLDNAKAFFVIAEEHAVLIPHIRGIFDSQVFAQGDLGIVSAYLSLAAADQGLGTCHIGIFDREAVCKALELDPQKTRINTLIAVGYPLVDQIRPKARKPLEDVATFV